MLHTNDLHSHLEPAAQIAGYVKEVRRNVPAGSLLVVDCGDFLDRARPETEGTDGGVNRNLLLSIGYDVLVPGNNEGLTYTAEQLDELYAGLPSPVVCANFRPLNPERAVPWLVPSLTVRKAGVTIGVTGLTAAFNDYYKLLGWNASDPFEAAAEQVAKLRRTSDVVIVLSHLGIRSDERLASSVDGIDLILGAHTHHLLEKPLYVGRTAICAAGKFGRHIGHLEITYHPVSGQIEVDGGCVLLEDRSEDAEAARIIAAGREAAERRMSRVVAVLDAPLACELERESPLAVLLAAAVRKHTGAEIGVVNAGQLLSGLPAGEVTEQTVHALCPSPINPCTMRVTGRELLRTMEESLQPEYYRLEIRGFGFRGHTLGVLCYDGLQAEADLSQPAGRRITSVRINGEPLDPDREYRVGTLDMFTFGVGHVGLKEGRNVRYYLPEFIRDLLAEALNDPAMIEQTAYPRILFKGQPS
ncbi:bifunctional metallophosphatase/5'-nucleotidase [Cohnella pontilimi]|uniref:Bifunctional metallophosphatase/5'-nucleotidase n=1 Tax=Cohnella pontilimi TaxID=2564100 RepID=A0A4V5LS37_9BACL|nr:bifunctional metallophosphatase/5'-nucleotidase [Cohnella pontilimi]